MTLSVKCDQMSTMQETDGRKFGQDPLLTFFGPVLEDQVGSQSPKKFLVHRGADSSNIRLHVITILSSKLFNNCNANNIHNFCLNYAHLPLFIFLNTLNKKVKFTCLLSFIDSAAGSPIEVISSLKQF